MNGFRGRRRNVLLVGLTLLLPLFAVLDSLAGIAALGLDYAGERSRIEPRVARLQGLLEHADVLQARSATATARLRELAYAPAQEATALAAALQADARRIMDVVGLNVSNSQVMPTRRDEHFERVAVKLTVNGSLPALNDALIGIAASRPQLLVESLDAFPVSAQRRVGNRSVPVQSVTAVIQLMALRQAPGDPAD